MTEDRERELLTKVTRGRAITPAERSELIHRLEELESDESQPRADRMGAIVLRAALLTGMVPSV